MLEKIETKKEMKQNLRDLWDHNKRSNIHVIRVPKERWG